jgi:hypothetical protein
MGETNSARENDPIERLGIFYRKGAKVAEERNGFEENDRETHRSKIQYS